jgi:hypothetical protein
VSADYLDGFADYGHDVWHCLRCHGLVRLDDACDDADRVAMLQGHRALGCRSDPLLGILVGGRKEGADGG